VTSTETCVICEAVPGNAEIVWWFIDGARRPVHTDCWIAAHVRGSSAGRQGPFGSAA
jgi:hypothetical protein